MMLGEPGPEGFYSYAQNMEDIRLYRALRQVGSGYYVDVGAQHPIEQSVTRAFYSMGWSGINIEPVEAYFRMLCIDRPRDINLRTAVLAAEGQAELFVAPDTGLSTTDRQFEQRARDVGFTGHHVTVPAQTLNAILREHRPSGDIHFLKIDVEGAEDSVLQGTDLERYRPWIVVLEALLSFSVGERELPWEDALLFRRGYKKVLFDGLNNFYVAEEKPDIADTFRTPPSIVDFGRLPANWFIESVAWARADKANRKPSLKRFVKRQRESLAKRIRRLRPR